MRDKEIDEILKQAAGGAQGVDPAELNRIANSLGSSIEPVRPLPPSWMWIGGLVLICVVVAIGGGMVLGPHGVLKMDGIEIALIFSLLGVLIWMAAVVSVAAVIPGRRRPLSPEWLAVWGCVALIAAFAVLFKDYRTPRFLSQGMTCLIAGLAHAVPALIAAWWLLARGYGVNPVTAGFAKGALAGLAGITMLELHCANFEAPHVMVWHIAVMPVAGALGALAGWAARVRREKGAR